VTTHPVICTTQSAALIIKRDGLLERRNYEHKNKCFPGFTSKIDLIVWSASRCRLCLRFGCGSREMTNKDRRQRNQGARHPRGAGPGGAWLPSFLLKHQLVTTNGYCEARACSSFRSWEGSAGLGLRRSNQRPPFRFALKKGPGALFQGEREQGLGTLPRHVLTPSPPFLNKESGNRN
jgi:hypothetical protein